MSDCIRCGRKNIDIHSLTLLGLHLGCFCKDCCNEIVAKYKSEGRLKK